MMSIIIAAVIFGAGSLLVKTLGGTKYRRVRIINNVVIAISCALFFFGLFGPASSYEETVKTYELEQIYGGYFVATTGDTVQYAIRSDVTNEIVRNSVKVIDNQIVELVDSSEFVLKVTHKVANRGLWTLGVIGETTEYVFYVPASYVTAA